MKNGVLSSTTNSGPVVDTSYQYINWSKEESTLDMIRVEYLPK